MRWRSRASSSTTGATPEDAQSSLIGSLYNERRAATVISGPWFINDIASSGVPWKVTTLPIVSATGQPARAVRERRGRDDVRARPRQGCRVRGDGLPDRRMPRRSRAGARPSRSCRTCRPATIRSSRPTPRSPPSAASSRRRCRCRTTRAMRLVWTPYNTALGEVVTGRAEPGASLDDVQRKIAGVRRAVTSVQHQLRDFAIAATVAVAIASAAFVSARNRDVIDHQENLAQRSAVAIANRRPADGYGPRRARRARDRHRRRIPTCVTARSRSPVGRGACSGPAGPPPRTTSCSTTSRPGSSVSGRRRSPGGCSRWSCPTHTELLADGTGRAVAVAPAAKPGEPRGRDHAARTARVLPAARDDRRARPRRRARRRGRAGRARRGARVHVRRHRGARDPVRCCGARGSRRPRSRCSRSRPPSSQGARLTDRLARGLRAHRTALGFLAPAAHRDARAGRGAVRDRPRARLLRPPPRHVDVRRTRQLRPDPVGRRPGASTTAELLVHPRRHRAVDRRATSSLHVTIGVALALVLSRSWLRGKGVFRMLLILPWAIPNYITALIWKGMFTGRVRRGQLAAAPVRARRRVVVLVVGDRVLRQRHHQHLARLPVHDGGRARRARDHPEGALRGRGGRRRERVAALRHITLPHLRPALGPAVALGSIWTFNMFNVIFLVSGGKPGGSTNILVTEPTAGRSSAASATGWPRPTRRSSS